ncbi:zinc-dependent metalloprotease [soil metagenome]
MLRRSALLLFLAAAAMLAVPAAPGHFAAGYLATGSLAAQSDLFTVTRPDGKIHFEIPDSILGRDMIIMSRYARTQEGLADVGATMGPNVVIRWERRDDRILIRGVSHGSTADSADNVSMAVEAGSFPSVAAALPIASRSEAGGGSSTVDVTDLYLGDHPLFSLPSGARSQRNVTGHDRERSWLEWVRSFPENVEVRVVRTYRSSNPPSSGRGGAVSFEVNHSMILLPEEPMQPRWYDERVGFNSGGVTDYSRDFQGVRPRQMIRRYRLEPSDPEAFARGELVDPVRPWVWWIDPATPEEWIPYVKAGVHEWVAAFEEAGFSNAIEARLAPTEAEDPEFSLLDARYSVIRWVPTMTRSANAGADVVDPRSGEALRGHITMLHGLSERMRWQLISQVAAADPRFRTARLGEEEMGEALRYVVSHEMAHAVGLPHNQRANFVYPIDSLRTPGFIDRMGHSASAVGRTRFNYVAQPGDGVPPERYVGIWDRFAVMWGYRPIPEATSADAEREVLDAWITERAHLPWFRFGSAQFGIDVEWDPYRMTEGISDDPVEAAVYGMANLRTAHENLMEWLLEEGDDFYELETHHLQLLTQWNRYAEHASAAVGGSWTHHMRVGEGPNGGIGPDGWVYTPIEHEYQRKAMEFLDAHVFETPTWALDLEILRRLEHVGVLERVRAFQVLAAERLLNHARLARLIEHEAFLGDVTYTPTEMLDDARAMLWREIAPGGAGSAPGGIDAFRRNLQRGYLEHIHHLVHDAESRSWSPPGSGNLRVSNNNDPPLNAQLHVGQSDIRPLLRDQLNLLRADIDAALGRGIQDRMTRIHLEDAVLRIEKTLAPAGTGTTTVPGDR